MLGVLLLGDQYLDGCHLASKPLGSVLGLDVEDWLTDGHRQVESRLLF